jgi:flap endonuclease-1
MGLNIRDIIPRKELKILDLKGKIVCVDAFNTLYQFLSTIRQPDGTPLMDSKKRVTSHLSGILYRNAALLSEGLQLVYVFDGKPPELKFKTAQRRRAGRDVAQERYERAKQSADLRGMKRYSSQLLRLDDQMISESKELLKAMGIAVVQAPSEGEAEAAHLCKKEGIYAAVSQDYDSLLFGAPKLVRNLTLARKRRTITGYIDINPELIELSRVLNSLEINLDQLICLGILVGTDYNPKGVPGIGQKKALEIVKKFKQPVLIFRAVEQRIHSLPENDQFDWKEIFELFHKHDVKDVDIKFPKVNEEKIKKLLIEEHEFSEKRVEKQLERLRKVKEAKKQTTLF